MRHGDVLLQRADCGKSAKFLAFRTSRSHDHAHDTRFGHSAIVQTVTPDRHPLYDPTLSPSNSETPRPCACPCALHPIRSAAFPRQL